MRSLIAGTTRGGLQIRTVMLVLAWAAPVGGYATDWPQYRGPNGNGVVTERINLDWPASGPKRLWTVPLTNGLSSITVKNGRVFTQVWRRIANQDTEFCAAFSADTGTMLWNQSIGLADYPSGGVGNDDGPRSTPSLHGDRVYVLGSYLDLVCLDAATGQAQWRKDLRAQFGGSVIAWQNAASPVVVGDLVLVNLNASPRRIAAFRASDGSLAWRGIDEAMTHATPVSATILGVPQVIFLTQKGLVAVAPEDGRQLWRYTFSYSTSTGASPVVADDTVYCSAAYGVGAAAIRLTQSGGNFSVAERWKRRGALMNHWSTAVATGGYVYGLYGQALHYSAPLKCVDLATGTENWSQDGFGLGATLLANDRVLALTEAGELVVVAPDPTQYREQARFQAVAGKAWNSPAISNGRLYVRSTTQMAAFDVSLPPPQPLRIGSVQLLDNDAMVFTLTSSDGQPIEPERANAMQVLTAPAVASAPAAWELQPATVTAAGAALHVEIPTVGSHTERYFKVVEQP